MSLVSCRYKHVGCAGKFFTCKAPETYFPRNYRVYELKFADAIYDFLAEILHRRHILQHSTYQCAYKSASAGLLDLQAQVAFLTNRAAVLGAALDSLPSQIDREQEEYAESQLKLLPPELVSQARAMPKDREWEVSTEPETA